MNRRTLLLGTGLFAAMGVSAKSLAMDASLPMKVADIDPAFQKAFNAGDADTLLKLYDDQSVLVAEPGKPVQGLARQAISRLGKSGRHLAVPVFAMAFSPSRICHPEPSGSRSATPALLFRHSAGQSLAFYVIVGLNKDDASMTGKVPMTEEVAVERAAATGRAVEASLEEFLTFERLLADLSARLANVSVAEVETEIDSALRELQEFLGFDRSNLFEFTADGWATIVCSVSRDAVERHPLGPAPAFLKWYLGQVRAGKIMRVQSIEDLPPEGTEQIEYHRRVGIRSSLGLPLRIGGRIVGAITFAAFRSTRKWPDDLIARLKVVGEVMAQTLMRKRAETALQASEERWRSMFEASNSGITVIDQNLQYLAANSAFQSMLGYTENELQQLTPLDVTVEEDRDAEAMRFSELKQGKRRHYEAVRQYRRKDGAVIWGHSYLSVVHDAETRPKMFIGTAIDVTETKRAQDALRETQSKLERVTRLTTMHTVTASIAHEVNQPLAAIAANGEGCLTLASKVSARDCRGGYQRQPDHQ